MKPIDIKANFITEQMTSNNMKHAKDISKRVKKINHLISKDLYKKDYLTTEKINNVKPSSKQNINHYWTTYIKKINYLKNNNLEIYVTSDFKQLSDSKRQDIIKKSEQLALIHIEKFRAVPESKYIDGLPATIFCDSSFLGRTEFLNSKEIAWKDE